MKFDGQVGDLGNKGSMMEYDVSYLGMELKPLEGYVLERCKEKGLEVLSIGNVKEKDGRWKVTARVRSMVGIV